MKTFFITMMCMAMAIVVATFDATAAMKPVETTVKDFGKADVYMDYRTATHVVYSDEKDLAIKKTYPLGNHEIRETTVSKGVVLQSKDGKHSATIVAKDGKQAVVYDDVEGPAYKEVSDGYLSVDGVTLAYHGYNSDEQQFVVIGEKRNGPYTSIGSWIISPDGKRLAVIANRKDKMMIVCDGVEGPAYEYISYRTAFSHDSRHFAYVGVNGKESAAVYSLMVNDKKVASGNYIGIVGFTPDNRRLVWVSGEGTEPVKYQAQAMDVATGKSEPLPAAPQGGEAATAASPDAKHLAFFVSAGDGRRLTLTVDGRPLSPTFEQDSADGDGDMIPRLDPPGFSADGKHVFCRGVIEIRSPYRQRRFVIIDGFPLPEHDNVWFLDDSRRCPERLRYIVVDDGKYRLMEASWPEGTTWEDAVKSKKG
jgi:hypothetical protein